MKSGALHGEQKFREILHSDRIVRLTLYETKEQALEAAGLSE